ncbi:MAG: hypothetical protein J6X55_12615, partial [Victivallales bacterium]|nr:hypothetical protein [Victivallales bacterium]
MTPFEFLLAIGENFAAGLFADPNACAMMRHAKAIECALCNNRLPDYKGTRLYPVGHSDIYNP